MYIISINSIPAMNMSRITKIFSRFCYKLVKEKVEKITS